MDDVTSLYLYRTGRDDGMDFCVGANFRESRVGEGCGSWLAGERHLFTLFVREA